MQLKTLILVTGTVRRFRWQAGKQDRTHAFYSGH